MGKRGYEAMERAFHEESLMIRVSGDTLAIAPPLIVTEAQIGGDLREDGAGDPGAGIGSS